MTQKLTEKKVLDYILAQEEYPTRAEALLAFGSDRIEQADKIISIMETRGDIVVDDKGEILVTKVRSEKLRESLEKARRVR